jgi:hypothetical protein
MEREQGQARWMGLRMATDDGLKWRWELGWLIGSNRLGPLLTRANVNLLFIFLLKQFKYFVYID